MAKDRAQATASAANILIELQRVERPLRTLEIFHSSGGGHAPNSVMLAHLAKSMDIAEPTDILAKCHELLPLTLDRVTLEAAVAISGLLETIKAFRIVDDPIFLGGEHSASEIEAMVKLRAKLGRDLSEAASKAWHTTARAIAEIGDTLGFDTTI